MKRIYVYLIAFLVLPTHFSCSDKEEPINSVFDLSDKVLKIEDITATAIRINAIFEMSNLNKISDDEKDSKLKDELKLFIDNGKTLFNETIAYLENIDYAELSDDERARLLDMDDQHLVEFSVVMSFAYNHDAACADTNKSFEEWDVDRVMSCIGAALGLSEIATIVSNTAQLTTIQGTTQLLKVIGRRYLGWFGVAVGVYSFGKCMDAW